MLVRDELDRMFDLALRDVCGCEIEPDEKDRMFWTKGTLHPIDEYETATSRGRNLA